MPGQLHDSNRDDREPDCPARIDRLTGLLAKKYGAFNTTQQGLYMRRYIEYRAFKRIGDRRLEVYATYIPSDELQGCAFGINYVLNSGRAGESKL